MEGRGGGEDPSENDGRPGIQGLGFEVWGLGFGVWGLGFGVWGLINCVDRHLGWDVSTGAAC